jgi:hypothetical protein
VGPAPEGGDGVLDRGIGRHHQDERVGPDPEEAVEQVEAAWPGQLDVAEDEVGLERLGRRQGRRGVSGEGGLVPLAGEDLLQGRGEDLLVVDHQDAAPRPPTGPGHESAPIVARAAGGGGEAGGVGSGRGAGNRAVKVVPEPGADSNVRVPPRSSTICRLTNRPRPVPRVLVVK